MKFALNKIRFIDVRGCNTTVEARKYVQKMYDMAYGIRAGTVRLDDLTPNEERLIEALMARFAYKVLPKTSMLPARLSFTGCRSPIAVYAGDDDFVFISCEPYEGPFIPVDDWV